MHSIKISMLLIISGMKTTKSLDTIFESITSAKIAPEGIAPLTLTLRSYVNAEG